MSGCAPDSAVTFFCVRQKKVTKVHAVGVCSLRAAKLRKHQKASRIRRPARSAGKLRCSPPHNGGEVRIANSRTRTRHRNLSIASRPCLCVLAECRARPSQRGRVGMWRGRSRNEAASVCRLVATIRCLLLPISGIPVSTSPSSNRTCRFPASGSRTRLHAFAHACSRPLTARRTSPKCPYRCESG